MSDETTCPECGETDSKEKCPKCGTHIIFGYGMAGGGMGAYQMCCNESCDYFDKTQDSDE